MSTTVTPVVSAEAAARVVVRMHPEVKRRLQTDAGRHGRSLSAHAAVLLAAVLPPAEPPSTDDPQPVDNPPPGGR